MAFSARCAHHVINALDVRRFFERPANQHDGWPCCAWSKYKREQHPNAPSHKPSPAQIMPRTVSTSIHVMHSPSIIEKRVVEVCVSRGLKPEQNENSKQVSMRARKTLACHIKYALRHAGDQAGSLVLIQRVRRKKNKVQLGIRKD